MADTANVNSIDALTDFRVAWVRFGEDARNALTDVDFELRRTIDWVNNDQRLYWQAEIKRANQALSQARTELHRKKLGETESRHPDTTVEERKVRAAKERLELSEDKLEAVRSWGPELAHAAQEYRSHSQPLGDMLEGDCKRALSALDRMIDALESYLALVAPSTPEISGMAGLTRDTAGPATPLTRPLDPSGAAAPATPAATTASEVATTPDAATPEEVRHG
jgi:hypothetical protein